MVNLCESRAQHQWKVHHNSKSICPFNRLPFKWKTYTKIRDSLELTQETKIICFHCLLTTNDKSPKKASDNIRGLQKVVLQNINFLFQRNVKCDCSFITMLDNFDKEMITLYIMSGDSSMEVMCSYEGSNKVPIISALNRMNCGNI